MTADSGPSANDKPDGCFRNCSWQIQTYTGRMIDLLNPQPEDICIEDIARGLALENRYNGATKFPISVAQHSIYVSQETEHNPKQGLLHDAAEAYCKDLTRPFKKAFAELGRRYDCPDLYRLIYRPFEVCIYIRFEIYPDDIMNADVSRSDTAVCRAEAKAVAFEGGETWGWGDIPAADIDVCRWHWSHAERMFLMEAESLCLI